MCVSHERFFCKLSSTAGLELDVSLQRALVSSLAGPGSKQKNR